MGVNPYAAELFVFSFNSFEARILTLCYSQLHKDEKYLYMYLWKNNNYTLSTNHKLFIFPSVILFGSKFVLEKTVDGFNSTRVRMIWNAKRHKSGQYKSRRGRQNEWLLSWQRSELSLQNDCTRGCIAAFCLKSKRK